MTDQETRRSLLISQVLAALPGVSVAKRPDALNAQRRLFAALEIVLRAAEKTSITRAS